MPRRKKKVTEPTESERLQEENEDILQVKKIENSFIVISDSDEEPGEENGLLRTRTMKQSDRAKCAAKRKITQMTEDEQFALALKMSEQEARQVNDQVEEEEELLRKAIAESLNSCQPSDPPATSPAHLFTGISAQPHQEEPVDSETNECMLPRPESPHSSATSLSQGSRSEQTEIPKSPLVMLKRLSQEVVEGSLASSIILSQEKNQPSLQSKESPSSPMLSDSSDNLSSPPGEKQFVLSPTFSRVPTGSWQLVPRKLFLDSSVSQEEVEEKEKRSEHMDDLKVEPLTDSSETGDALDQPVLESKGSGFFDSETNESTKDTKHIQPKENSRLHCGSLMATPEEEKTSQLCLPSTVAVKDMQEDIGGTVHYYWGIPFCPTGVDPNQYTKVILCQLEVYQKSLKLAQRQLLQKKEFGEPILPSSPSLLQKKHDERDQAKGVNEDMTEERGNENTVARKETRASSWHNKIKDLQGSPLQSLQEKPLLQEEPTTSQHQSSQLLFAEDIPEEDDVMTITSSTTALSLLASQRSPVITRGISTQEITVCPETQLSPSEVLKLEREEECLARKERPIQAAVNENIEKEMSASIFSAHIQVSCPMCDQGFPPTEIELHAMYCNGLVGEEESRDSPVLTRKRKQAKSKSDSGRDIQPSLDIDKSEKCYLCKSLVPIKEYPSHVDLCLKTATDDQGSKMERGNGQPSDCESKNERQKNTSEGEKNEGRLLSLLEQSEHKSADTEMKTESSEGEAFRYDSSETEKADCSKGDQSCFNLSDSPIKSFVSISEAKDCLVDFKKQLSIRPGGRKRTKASRGKRRKS